MWVFSKSQHFTALGSVYSTVTADKPTNDFLYFPEFKLYVKAVVIKDYDCFAAMLCQICSVKGLH